MEKKILLLIFYLLVFEIVFAQANNFIAPQTIFDQTKAARREILATLRFIETFREIINYKQQQQNTKQQTTTQKPSMPKSFIGVQSSPFFQRLAEYSMLRFGLATGSALPLEAISPSQSTSNLNRWTFSIPFTGHQKQASAKLITKKYIPWTGKKQPDSFFSEELLELFNTMSKNSTQFFSPESPEQTWRMVKIWNKAIELISIDLETKTPLSYYQNKTDLGVARSFLYNIVNIVTQRYRAELFIIKNDIIETAV